VLPILRQFFPWNLLGRRKAGFLIANAVDAGDRRKAEDEIRKLGVDPRKVRTRTLSKR
jgi:hypothetical protein